MLRQRLVRAVLALCLGLLCSLAAEGCIAVVPYTPDDTVLDKLGPAEARKRLQETMTRAQEPRIVAVEATEEFVDWRWNQVIHGAYGIPVGTTTPSSRIYYANLSKLELYENHNVYIYAPGENLAAKILYQSEADAKLFMDLMASFRAKRLSGK